MSRERVLVMDYAWPDLSIETDILNAAGFDVVSVVDDGRPAVELVSDCSAIMTCWALVPAELLQAGSTLRMVARFGVGTDNIDVKEARRLGLEVTYVPDYCMEEVSDHALALALAWYRGVVALDRMMRAREWNPSAAKLRRMSSLTVGVWGYGRIGRRTARSSPRSDVECSLTTLSRNRVRQPRWSTSSVSLPSQTSSPCICRQHRTGPQSRQEFSSR